MNQVVKAPMKSMKHNSMYLYLMVLTIASTAGLQSWRTLFNNFAVDVALLDGSQVGVIQSVREIPGFLTLLVVFVMLYIKEHRLSALSIAILGIGVGATGLFPTYGGLVATTMVMSFGFHYFETTNQSLTLQYFDRDKSPRVFGDLRAVSGATNILVGLAIYLAEPFLSYAQLYSAAGGAITLAGIWGYSRDPSDAEVPAQRKRMVFRKKYWLYYVLTFLAGARRQIFVAFAVFLLVEKFGFSVREITLLFVVNNAINYLLSPLIGKWVVRYGERKVLSLEYFSLIFIFSAYATVDSKALVALLYILDHVFFNFSFAIRTYFQKVGDPKDIAPSMAVGFTINHIAAVFFPAVGGALWMVDYRIPFICGAFISLASLTAVQFIRVEKGVAAKGRTGGD